MVDETGEIRNELRQTRKMIGHNIYLHRHRRRMSMEKMAKLTHISVKKLDYFEMGKGEIHLQLLVLIAKALNVSTHTLLTPNRDNH